MFTQEEQELFDDDMRQEGQIVEQESRQAYVQED